MVMVDVIATDKEGKVISNLTLDDFEIFNGVYNLDFSRCQLGEYILKIKCIDSVNNTESDHSKRVEGMGRMDAVRRSGGRSS